MTYSFNLFVIPDIVYLYYRVNTGYGTAAVVEVVSVCHTCVTTVL